ncbi:MAG: Mrp/NBP35 family ATP-binding protein [Lachnospiraceae bacterium]|nr:Mrp/NBP35 family ATP-binding protein [Lachnospiraceae bacterium]
MSETIENCTHNCSTCGANCSSRQGESAKINSNDYSQVKRMIGVVSGKGGVGKSLVTALSAVAARREGKQVGILDADVTGPSIPKLFGVHEKAMGSDYGIFPADSKDGVKLMSVNLLLENEGDPVLWRGPVIAGVVTQFWTDVLWGDLDYLFVDMPPGTGDVALTVFQSLPLSGIIIVTSPQDLVSMIVEKAARMAEKMNIPILGIIENMSYLTCPDCGKKIDVFGESHVEKTAMAHGISDTLRVPIMPEIAKLVDEGRIEEAPLSLTDEFSAFLGKIHFEE